MKFPPECWCFARFAGKAPTFWVNSYAETSLHHFVLESAIAVFVRAVWSVALTKTTKI
ncbi:hypothetical protein [Leptolyngbya sp. FACHB-16]|uniref:hypothetical protein n=1 Tax=unclassified Leptolyngbya TaxID=2650499 RepID=UPI0016854605|nr:hypothetical protein [Leptolyngbya sp. FACHB-16]MBD2157696.1 hypothetical protein [Leptolyngbya sp. FACHB-16]